MRKLNNFQKKVLIFSFILAFLAGCQDNTPDAVPSQVSPANNPVKQDNQPAQKPKPTAAPKDDTTDISPDDKEIVGTDTETTKTNIDWKAYNPVTKGKKYTYVYKDADIQTDILREITDVQPQSYTVKQTIVSSGKTSQLASTRIIIAINPDNSPAIIPVVSVGGEKIAPASQVEITEKPEKITVPFKEIECIKVVSKTADSTTNNWYGKDIGLVKAEQTSKAGTYSLELKDFN